MQRKASVVLLGFVLVLIFAGWKGPKKKEPAKFLGQDAWVDSVMTSLTPEQRLGQLFMVAAYSNKNEKHVQEIEELVSKYNIGGLIFFQGGPVRQAILTNRYQSQSKVPLFIAMDAEWGLGMRLDSTMSFPKQMTLGAIDDDKYIYKMGVQVARQCRRLGVHINFAPVVDINSNPNNPVIGMRSFGESKENVARKGIAYMKGMQDNKVMANAKHFPGHGDTGSDSHLTLPVINHSKERLSETELFPFRKLIKDSLMSIMVAHIHVPAYDSEKNKATTLSKYVVTDLLKTELNFQGLVFTDALNMKGVSSFYKPGEVDVLALLAGNDVLLYAENVPLAIKKIQKAIKDKDISQEEVDARVRKILRAKYWAGLYNYKPVEVKNLYNDLNSSSAKAVQQELFEKSVTLVKNERNVVPVRVLDNTSFASVSIGSGTGNEFQKMLDNYALVKHFSVSNKAAEDGEYEKVFADLKQYDMVFVGLHGVNSYNNKDYGITEQSKRFIKKLQESTNVVLCVFGTPYSLKFFADAPVLICGYEDNEVANKVVPQVIFGGIHTTAKLPVTVHQDLTIGTGISSNTNIQRLRYAYPENAGMNSATLKWIDSIAYKAIAEKATPGCQVLAVKNGTVVFKKAYGHLTYNKDQEVDHNTIYDIASVSKVAGTLQAVMFLQERDLIDINKKASFYLPELKGTNKEDMVIKDILTHQAGLVPFIPHWKRTIDTSGFSKCYYSPQKDEVFCKEVIPGLYCISSISDSLWKWTIESDLLKKPTTTVKKGKKTIVKKSEKYNYVYSDLGFYIMHKMVERIINQPLEEFMQQNFFDPLGLSTVSYNPLCRFSQERIAPTEEDRFFRKVLVRGTVHDQGAALLGGVGGHAGMFSNANDLAKIMQMNLQNGFYGGTRYFLPGTVSFFSKKHIEGNRRGLGWDKPEPDGNGPTSDYASPKTYGHTGFTGTAAWIDPDQQLVYIFLSNRVCPDANNQKLIKMGVRTAIQDVLYKSILNYTAQ
ncbi:MAG: glycoside hydrolase family 3 N-terminal domain-containing protein [Cytophagaceae bacterium]